MGVEVLGNTMSLFFFPGLFKFVLKQDRIYVSTLGCRRYLHHELGFQDKLSAWLKKRDSMFNKLFHRFMLTSEDRMVWPLRELVPKAMCL